MKWFSQRIGAKSIQVDIQKSSMDEALRTRLWNLVYMFFLEGFNDRYGPSEEDQNLVQCIWNRYINEPLNQIPQRDSEVIRNFQNRFFAWEWCDVYDFLEAVLVCCPDSKNSDLIVYICNQILEEELSAYRIVNGRVAEITSEHEIATIEEALANAPNSAKAHLGQALQHFSNRENPDYRNSIKESISAVEAIAKKIAGDSKATLGDALKKIDGDGKVKIHGGLKAGMSSIYGWTSDGDGIRHTLMDEPNIDAEDAKYMLVSCSAFVNYLIVKADKAGIKL